jgi:hypothetical protein
LEWKEGNWGKNIVGKFRESEGGVPEQLRAFFRSPLYMLSERDQEETKASIPEFEKQRRAAVANCRYQVFHSLIHS